MTIQTFDAATRPRAVFHDGRNYLATGRVRVFSLSPADRGIAQAALDDAKRQGFGDDATVDEITSALMSEGKLRRDEAQREAYALVHGGRRGGQPFSASLAEYRCFDNGAERRVWADERGRVVEMAAQLKVGDRVEYKEDDEYLVDLPRVRSSVGATAHGTVMRADAAGIVVRGDDGSSNRLQPDRVRKL